MRIKIGFLAILMLTFFCGFGQQQSRLSPMSQISVITCGTGDQLYSSFGHSAFRVQDPVHQIDWVYNYGTFNFNTPNFYLKFARGKLLYSLSRERFEEFLYTYQLENRWVKEQILDLSTEDKIQIFDYLEQNYKPENRDYKYDFIHENCSTKMPEVLNSVLGNSITYSEDHLEEAHSFRQLIQSYLYWNTWASFGIDLALGAVIDRKAEPKEYMFLPDYVLLQLNNASVHGQPIVQRQRTILDLNNGHAPSYFTTSPLFWFLLFFVFTLTITYIDYRNHVRSRWLDFFIFGLSGLTGCFILFLWFLTDHSATAYNFNIIWALPSNAVLAYYLCRKGETVDWIGSYIRIAIWLLLLVPVLWVPGLQEFSPIVLLISVTLALRYGYLLYYYRHIYPGLQHKNAKVRK